MLKTLASITIAALCSFPLAANASQGDDPDMKGREGIPPNSVGSGTRAHLTQEELDYWRLINGSKKVTIPSPPTDNPSPAHAVGAASRSLNKSDRGSGRWMIQIARSPESAWEDWQSVDGTVEDLNTAMNLIQRTYPGWGVQSVNR